MSEERQFLKGFTPLQHESDDFKIIEFKLQLSLGSSSVVVKSIYDIADTHLSSEFSNYAKGSIIVQSFMLTDKLTENNKLAKVCQKGYDFTELGEVFNVGYNQIRDAKKEHCCVMNKISVGKSYCYPSQKTKDHPIQCPEGFDSIYLYNEQESPQVFKHQYLLFKTYQALPIYVINFVIDRQKQQLLRTPFCDNCDKKPPELAKFYCVTENANFCQECDDSYHKLSKVANKHIRVEINQKPKKFGFCKKHELTELDLYCSTCCEAICMNCKISGSHMTGAMATHALNNLKDSYSEISSKVKEIDPNIERRKNQLTDDLNKIDLKIKEINSKATEIEEQLRSIFEKALRELKNETQKKLSFLICDQLELKRQYDHIQWMDSFIKHQLEVQEPNEFLNSWYKFSKYKREVLSLSNLSINTEVKADMKLEGEIRVVVEGKFKKNDPNLNIDKDLSNEVMQTPSKEPNRNSPDKEFGSTQLRKTIFKKHYVDKMREMGDEPTMVKGGMPNFKKVPVSE